MKGVEIDCGCSYQYGLKQAQAWQVWIGFALSLIATHKARWPSSDEASVAMRMKDEVNKGKTKKTGESQLSEIRSHEAQESIIENVAVR